MPASYKERFRPQFHFSPQNNWKNDPHGLIYHDGEYHLFYQHNAKEPIWGPMSWGHAVSDDLVTWRHIPIAIPPDEIGGIWTGSVVYDRENTFGLLPNGGLVAIYSYEDQSVGLSYSNDRGRSWYRFFGNPVIPSPGGNFRDPQVFWLDETQRWHMAITCEQSIQFYESINLCDWSPTGDFTAPVGKDAPWEVPDIFFVDLEEARHWILLVSMDGAPAGGSGVRYFIGEFDGKTFRSQTPLDAECWMDHGPDNYAGSTWKNVTDQRRIYIGWMNDWRYAEKVPTQGWRGSVTLPRELQLVNTQVGLRLSQEPLSEMKKQRGELNKWENILIESGRDFKPNFCGNQYELLLKFQPQSATGIKISILKGEQSEVDVCYNAIKKTIAVNRMNSGHVNFHDDFPSVSEAPINFLNDTLSVHIFVDHSSVEVFANEGEVVLSKQVFPAEDGLGIKLSAQGGSAWLDSMSIWQLNSIWDSME